MMVRESPWIDVPALLDDDQLAQAKAAFAQSGVDYWSHAVMTSVGPMGGTHAYALHVSVEHARVAAKLLRNLLELDDPAEALPFTGACPACGEAAVDVWACPSCELGFRSPHDENDPMIVFLRDHGGFREP